MLIIPAIDLNNGRCVRLTQGLRNSARVYDDDPVRQIDACLKVRAAGQ